MTSGKIETTITGGRIQGIAGAESVVIHNFTINNRPVDIGAAPEIGAEPTLPCPYPGLAYFGPGDAGIFFGRDASIDRLIEAVSKQSLTALLGASGCGKSSVVLAGLAPRLHSLGGWRFSHFRIGVEFENDPFWALARALVPLYQTSESDTERLRNIRLLATSLKTGELGLRDVFAECRSQNKGSRVLLIADQFEETFTLLEDEATRHRFIDVLLAGFPDSASGDPEISLVLTLRADFYGRALVYRPLADALQGHVENLGPMNRQELAAAIRCPAEKAAISFEPGLVEKLLDELEGKPGSLPLLQFALREMWGLQETRRITHKSYHDIGGVQGAVAQRAETIFAAMAGKTLGDQTEQAFRRLFTRLVTLGEGQEDTRRVVDQRELGDDLWSLAQRLADEDNRLVVTNAPALSRETAEVVHEALIRHWPRLIDWLDRDRAFQTWLRHIRVNVELWSADPLDDGALLRGSMLAQATEWLAQRRADLNAAEFGLIEASLALRRRTEQEREAERQAEIRRQAELTEAALRVAKRQKRRARIAGVLAALGIITAVVTYSNDLQYLGSTGRALSNLSNSDEPIPISESARANLQASLTGLSAYLQSRLDEMGAHPEFNTWSVAQTWVALHGLDASLPPSAAKLREFMTGQRDASCYCWRETEDKLPHTVATSWVLYALALYDQPATPEEIASLLDRQRETGWWSMFPPRPIPAMLRLPRRRGRAWRCMRSSRTG